MRKISSILALAAVLLSGCTGGKPQIDTESVSGWKSPLGSFYGTSMMMEDPKPPLKVAWEKRLGAYTKSSPVTAGGVVVCADNAGTVYCIDGKTSETLWARSFAPFEGMQPVIGKNVIYVCDGKPTLNCLDINTGNSIWTFSLEGNPVGWPINGEGRVWVCSGNNLTCLEESKGTVIFKKKYGAQFTVSPMMQLHVYMAAGKRLIAANPENGQVAWEKEFARDIIAPVSCNRTELFVVDGSLHKLRDTDGATLQSYTNDRVIDSKTGNWISDPKLEAPFTTGAALYVNMIAIGTARSEILGFQITDISKFVLYHRVNYPPTAAPLVTKDHIWFTTPDYKDTGRFFCIANAINAKWVWHDWIDEPISSHPAGTSEYLYILSDNGLLKRYETGGAPVDPAEDSKRKLDRQNKEKPNSP